MYWIKLTILFALSLIAGVVCYHKSEYIPFTLVIQAKTLDKSMPEVVAFDQNGKKQGILFELGNDSGESSVYSIDLPRTLLKNVTIPPLAAPGRYEIESITLSNQSVSYHWSPSVECVKHFAADPVGYNVPCASGAPDVSFAANAAITISEIPATGVAEVSSVRVLKTILVTLLLLSSGLYLQRPVAGGTGKPSVYAERIGWLLFLALYLYQFSLLLQYSVDLPYWEEWEFFEPVALQRGFPLEWFFCHSGSTQPVQAFTRFMAWLNFKLFSLDFVKLKVMNYAIFGIYLFWLTKFARRVTGGRFMLFPWFMIFLVSPLAYEVHYASFQSGEVFVLLFMLVMLNAAIPPICSYKDTLIFSCAGLCTIFSMHTGLAVAGLLLICRTASIATAIREGKLQGKEGLKHAAISWILILSGILFWFSGFRQPGADAPPMLLPVAVKFWDQFFNLLGFGFGFDEPNSFPGIICLLLVVVPLVLLLKERGTRWLPTTWQVIPAILALLAITFMIALGRGSMSGSIKISRYSVYISPLIPFGAVAWWLVLKEGWCRRVVLIIFWVFCCGAFIDNWRYIVFRDLHQIDLLNVECVESYNRGVGDGMCPETHIVPIGRFFDNARKLDINFTRRFTPSSQPK